MEKPYLSLIVAIAENNAMGNRGRLPWRMPSDLARFKALTTGHALIMGRRTFESIGRALPGRDSIVISKKGVQAPPSDDDSLVFVSSWTKAIQAAKKSARKRGKPEIFVIGGVSVFERALPEAKRLYLTRVHGTPEADVHWSPDLSSGWVEVSHDFHDIQNGDEYARTDFVYERDRG